MLTTSAFSRSHLADIARELGSRQLSTEAFNAEPGIEAPAQSSHESFDRADWGVEFVAHCVRQAGFALPSERDANGLRAFASVQSWVAWAELPANGCYFSGDAADFAPDIGDLVIFASQIGARRVEQMGVIVDQTPFAFVTAEGNVKDRTRLCVRRKSDGIAGFILLVEAHETPAAVVAARIERLKALAEARPRYGWKKSALPAH